ncbi:MAG: autotransporter-associated beta strand repeat-containing protein [Luteolibacter sp.]|uniref:beta strand repeat-containing protein n=1 Tax=Luteolibacter sp. TaxID=1962973 RepID=UPI003263C3DE
MKPTRINHLNWSRSAGTALTVTLITFCGQTMHAADWGGGTSTDWNTAANWSGNAVPTGVDANIFAGAGNFSVISATPTGAPKAVWIGNYGAATGRLDLTGGALTVTSADWPGGPLIVGYGQDGKGTCNITGTASLTTGSFGDIRVGSGFWWGNSTGVLNVNTTGTVHANGHLAIGGRNGDVGTVNVDAGTVTIGGGWQVSVDIAAGSATSPSSGSLNISGGTVSMDHRLVIAGGYRSGAGTEADPYVYANGSYVGTVTMTGGTLTTDATHNENWHGGLSMAAGFDEATGGTATFNLDGGTLSTLFVFTEAGNNGIAGTSTFNFNGGTLQGQANYGQFMGGLTRANVRDGGAVINTNGFNLNIGQVLEHSDIIDDLPIDGGLTKDGAGRLELAGGFTYTGNTTVNAGTLAVNQASFSDASTITIADGATLNLNTGTSDTVGALVLGVTTMTAPGTYGAVGNANADFTSDRITGSGLIELGAAAPYTTWANANGATTQTMDLDHDNDGVDNGIEYFMGQTGSTFTANPAAVGGTITWPMGANYTGAYGTDYEVQYSTNLVIWTQAPIGSGDNTVVVTPGTSVVYDAPTGGKSFVRLVVKN